MNEVLDVLSVLVVLEPELPILDLACRAVCECEASIDVNDLLRAYQETNS